MLALLALLLTFVRGAASDSSGFLQKSTGVDNSSASLAANLRIQYPPLPDFLQNLGCEIFWDGEYVKCEGCKYDDSSELANRKVTHTNSISSSDALFIMTQSGLDVFSKVKVSGGSGWEFYGVNFDTQKTPIWESVRFNKDMLKCGAKDAEVVYLRLRKKFSGSIFLTDERRRDLKQDLDHYMGKCYSNDVYAGVKETINSVLDGMDMDAKISIQQTIFQTLLFAPMIFLPELSIAESLLGETLKNWCPRECAEAATKLKDWITGSVVDSAKEVAHTAVTAALSKTRAYVEETEKAVDMLLQAFSDFGDTLRANYSSMSNQQILYWVSRYNTSDPRGNCSVDGASKYVHDATKWYKSFAKIGKDHVDIHGHSWVSYFNGVCTKGSGTSLYYVENMLNSGYGDHVHCSLPEESTWVKIPREYSMTARKMCNKPWKYSPAGFECENPKLNCFTHYTDF